ncbi:MAG: tetratricopeptide repeat protein [bacterium]|nr:tetratricopeptide repeat protein [bacterium]
MYKNRIYNINELEDDIKKIISLLDNGNLNEAEILYNTIYPHHPYNDEISYRFAGAFAKLENQNIDAIRYYLSCAIDIDSSYIELVLEDPEFKDVDISAIHKDIKNDEYSRMWNVIKYKQVEPEYDDRQVILKFDLNNQEKINNLFHTFHDRVQNTFLWTEEDYTNEPINEFVLETRADRHYVHYGQVYLALRELAPYCKDARFFMSSEPVCWVDEIVIENGTFYGYRHETEGPYWDNKLEAIEDLSEELPNDENLKKYISYEYSGWASYVIGREFAFSTTEDDTDYKRAVEYLDTAFKYNPHNSEVFYNRGRIYQKEGSFEKSRENFETAIKLQPGHFFGHYFLAMLHFNNKNYLEAIELFTRALHINPDYTKLYFYRGMAYEEIGNADPALENYETHINKTAFHIGSSLYRSGYKLFEKGFFSSSFMYYSSVLEKNKEYRIDLDDREKKSASDYSSNFYHTERERLNKLDAKCCVNISVIPGDILSDYNKSLEYCNRALEYDPDSPDAWYNIGYINQKSGNIDEALTCYEKTISLDENYCKALHNMSIILMAKGDYSKARDCAHRVLQKEPVHFDALIVMGNIFTYLKKYHEALPWYEKAIEVNPESDPGYHGAGYAYSWLREYEKSIEYYMKAISINPQNDKALSDMGSNLNNLGRYEEALEYLDEAIYINPHYYHPYYCKACVFALTGKEYEAISMIKKTLEVDPLQKDALKNEPDFEGIRKLKEFRELF